MAEILGLGLSHYPGPMVPVQHWPVMLQWNVENGRVPRAVYEDRSRWPAEMLKEMGDDSGQAAARAHRDRLLAGYRELRGKLDDFKPDFVLIWGDDQYENFRKDCIPPFCVYIFDELISHPFGGGRPFKTKENAWGLPEDAELRIKGHRAGARGLATWLLGNEFDVAYAYTTRHEHGLAHSFNNTIVYLDYDLGGFPYPVVPMHVNCYGNQLIQGAAAVVGEGEAELSPPAPSPRRCFELGRATARYLRESPWRVALIATSSWSHGSLTAKHQRLYPDLAADRSRYNELKSGGFRQWGELALDDIVDAGQHEILNWVCLAGAMTELGRSAEVVDYVESYVFNSSKCFALFPPQQTVHG